MLNGEAAGGERSSLDEEMRASATSTVMVASRLLSWLLFRGLGCGEGEDFESDVNGDFVLESAAEYESEREPESENIKRGGTKCVLLALVPILADAELEAEMTETGVDEVMVQYVSY